MNLKKYLIFLTYLTIFTPLINAMECNNEPGEHFQNFLNNHSSSKKFNPNQIMGNEELELHQALVLNNKYKAYETFSRLAAKDAFAQWHMNALTLKARALYQGNDVERNIKEAIKCLNFCYHKYQEPRILSLLAEVYEFDPEDELNVKLAAKFYKMAYEKGEGICETGSSPTSSQGDFEGLAERLKGESRGVRDLYSGFAYARLSYFNRFLQDKIKPDEILKYMRPYITNLLQYRLQNKTNNEDNSNLYIYAYILLQEQYIDEYINFGIPALERAAAAGDSPSLFQLSGMYMNGTYVDKDEDKAKSLIKKLLATPDNQFNLQIKAIVYVRGLCVEQDIRKAINLLNLAKKGPMDISIFSSNLIGEINGILDGYSFEELLEDENSDPKHDLSKTKRKQKKKRRKLKKENLKGNLKEQNQSGQSQLDNSENLLTDKFTEEFISNPISLDGFKLVKSKPRKYKASQFINILKNFNNRSKEIDFNSKNKLAESALKSSIEKCNRLSIEQDGSYMELSKNSNLIIHDPKFGKEFLFPINPREFHEIEPFKFIYDDRITDKINNLELNNDDNHRFGVAVDYAMQLFGVLDLFNMPDKKKIENSLLHSAILDKNIKGNFEYTFYKDSESEDFVLYHRLFRNTGINKK